ncbi:ADP-ribose diphosphatase [Rosenbergiella australiborealis]|uniref:ADP-ribose pyrophosphatase n=1 Tax=Rosenbergiella australiborealis TaxID=1544696 RepID=A0ABS5T434_9GAMM|nr:ADP-ribose diphosphatase [Rosenbergiella australiborealis]MBT0727115.1 ADP-ribose diphosphatase [Rosenbergiella australiborealis]
MCKKLKSPTQFTRDDVEIVHEEPMYKGFFSITKYRFRHRLYAGGMSNPVEREVFQRGKAVALLPYDPVRDEVVLIEQIRIPALDADRTPWLIELVAGICEIGESEEEVARREADEEAGLALGRTKPVLSYLSSPGGSNERLAIWVGEVDAAKAEGNHGLASENEDILVRVVSRELAYQWVESGVIDNAASIIALQWLTLHHEQLRNEWLSP